MGPHKRQKHAKAASKTPRLKQFQTHSQRLKTERRRVPKGDPINAKNTTKTSFRRTFPKKHQKRSQREKWGTFLGPFWGPIWRLRGPKRRQKRSQKAIWKENTKKNSKSLKTEAQTPSKMGPKTTPKQSSTHVQPWNVIMVKNDDSFAFWTIFTLHKGWRKPQKRLQNRT